MLRRGSSGRRDAGRLKPVQPSHRRFRIVIPPQSRLSRAEIRPAFHELVINRG